MQNSTRERLIPIVKDSLIKHIGKSCNLAENIVDDLLNENVIVQPVALNNNNKKRMVELLDGFYEETGLSSVHYFTDEESEMIAEYILADGWMRPPCKIGTKVYLPCLDDEGEIETYEITDFVLDKDGLRFVVNDEDRETHSIDIIGKACFFDEEQAKQKLKEQGDK